MTGRSRLVLDDRGASGDADQMAKAFEKYHPTKVIREPIPDETVENLKEALEGQGESS